MAPLHPHLRCILFLSCACFLSSLAFAANYCGSSFSDARNCVKSCPRGLDSECNGKRCYASVTCRPRSTSSTSSTRTVSRRTCGSGYFNAFKCARICPRGRNSECPNGERCYANIRCSISAFVSRNSCGRNYFDAFKCARPCPRGFNTECPTGERCYARILCGSSSTSPSAPTPPRVPTPSRPPSSSRTFAAAVARVSVREHSIYGGRNECSSSSMRARVGQYWRALNLRLDGCNRDQPWSAAFISFMARTAGAGTRFRYSSAHRVYIADAFRGGRGLYGSVRPTSSTTVRVGDLVCSGRSRVSRYRYSDFLRWYRAGARDAIPTHCDFVTAVSGSRITTIGGNLSNTVRRQTVSKTSYAIVLPVSRTATV